MEYQHVIHPFEPIYDEESRVLILGSLPSVQSRANDFYYGHKQNRFWKVLAGVFNEEVPQTIEDKLALLHNNHVAIWDVIQECDIKGSNDASIKNVIPTNIEKILRNSNVKMIFANGATAGKLYSKFQLEQTKCEAINLPSTSPANAAWNLDRLIDSWKIIDVK